jgi:hypothetical protein
MTDIPLGNAKRPRIRLNGNRDPFLIEVSQIRFQ